jgi:hypothetical protein
MEWIERFKKATPTNLHVGNAILLAMLIHHLTTIKKQNIVKLSRKYLNDFGLNFRRIKPYLLSFQEAGLIELWTKDRSMTQIKLLLLDPYQYVPNYKQRIQKSKYKGTKGTIPKREQPCTRTGSETVLEREQLHSSHARVGRKGR